MTEEIDEQYEYLDPSNVSEWFNKHMAAMKPTANQPIGKSFAIAPVEDFDLELLRKIANQLSGGKLAFVVINWGNNYEVQRLPDRSDIKLFYKVALQNEDVIEVDTKDEIKRICNQYFDLSIDLVNTYDKSITESMREAEIITHTYIQKRVAALACFRNSNEGGKKALKDAIDVLTKLKFLYKLDSKTANSLFNKKGKLYKITKD